jgi:U4/U6 small nuclear ribonucleoprotein PRP31
MNVFLFFFLCQVDLEDLLPAASVMVVTVTATTTAGKALSEELLQKVEAGCDMALQLDEDKQQVGCSCCCSM